MNTIDYTDIETRAVAYCAELLAIREAENSSAAFVYFKEDLFEAENDCDFILAAIVCLGYEKSIMND